MSAMPERTVPGTDLTVSALGFGAWATGGLWWGDDVDDRSSTDAIRAAVAGGVTLFDTAPLYGHGHADAVLARALGGDRQRVILATKVGVTFGGEPQTGSDHARSDLRPHLLRPDVEASLRRLRTDTIDLLQIHWPCESGTPLEDTLGELHRLRDEGLVRHIGLCNDDLPAVERALEVGPLATLQIPLSLVRREAERTLLPGCSERDVGVIAYEALCRGLLSGRFGARPPSFPQTDLRARDPRFAGSGFQRAAAFTQRIQAAAERLRVPTSALALAWVARRLGVTCTLFGAKTAAQVEQNLQAARILRNAKPATWRVIDTIADTFTGW